MPQISQRLWSYHHKKEDLRHTAIFGCESHEAMLESRFQTLGHPRHQVVQENGSLYRSPMESINLEDKLSRFTDHWSPRIIARLNGQDVKLAKFSGAFDWHSHRDADELFLVLKGAFRMEFRDRAVDLREGEMIVVPRTVEHRPVAEEECAVLLFEPAGLLNTGEEPTSDRTTSGNWI